MSIESGPLYTQTEAPLQEMQGKSADSVAREYLESIPTASREMISILDNILALREGGALAPNMIEDARALLGETGQKYGFPGLWNALCAHGNSQSRLAEMSNDWNSYDMAYEQDRHHQAIVDELHGDYFEEGGNTFGLYEPTYRDCLDDKLLSIKTKPELSTLLLGSMARETANEFGAFSRELNSNAHPIAIDILIHELQFADNSLVQPMQADATELPFTDNSQDIVFTNFLNKFLRTDGLISGEKIMKMIQEASRVLKVNGRLVILEGSIHREPSNNNTWLHKLLLETSFRECGLELVPTTTVRAFKNHKQKEWGMEMGVIRQISPETMRNSKPSPFVFSAVGEKQV